ncbi:MAG: type III polyketide synthase, partial [Cyclonatronaceae bacterium]
MPAYIHHIATGVPENYFTQPFARDFMKHHIADRPALKRVLHSIYARSAIEKRHSVIRELHEENGSGIFFEHGSGRFLNPGTGARNQRYTDEAKELFVHVAAKTLEESHFEAADVTHVITVSCTGFFAPGPDYFIVRNLGLRPETRRYHIGFMGCYAAFPALKMAESITAENPDAVVLIAAVELCTLHLQSKTDTDSLISASVFADGGAGVLVSAKAPEPTRPAFAIRGLHTALTPQGERDMAWTIGDNGFDMVLSTYIPDIIEANLGELLKPFFESHIQPDAFGYWAVHPGGRAIVDKIQHSLGLDDAAIAPSRETLRD